MSIYREIQKTVIAGEEIDYIAPELPQIPWVTQWIVQGFAPTFMSQDKMQGMTSMEIFEEAIGYVSDINSGSVAEETRSSIWGSALITSDATIQYLFPALEQCFPGIELGRIKGDVLNEVMTLFFQDYFSFINNNS